MFCDCYDDMVQVAMRTGANVRPACMTAKHEKRWLELVGDLYLQRQDLLDSPFDEEEFELECPPEWCHTKEQFKAYWKLQEKFMKIETIFFMKWKALCMEEGRHPQLYIPGQCACCGAPWPGFFNVPDKEWKRFVIPVLQKKVLCRQCYDRIKAAMPGGWRSKRADILREGRQSWTSFLAENGFAAACAMCGEKGPLPVPGCAERAKYVLPELEGDALCGICLDKLKKLFPRGWRKAAEPRPIRKAGLNR
jgi:hypothetical protein